MSPFTEQDESFLRRAMALAMNGRGRVEPNPMVGCVIVKDNRIIGEGFHEQFGGPHAEPNALAACSESPQGATAYVTLEPCGHTNKKTPPCAPRLIEAGLARIVIGCLDPNPAVSGRGAAMLRQAGIPVDAPLLEASCKQLIAPFIARMIHHRPYVTLKWAQTADGKVAGPAGGRLQISNVQSTRRVHELRASCDAIMVGVNTVIADNPSLTIRGVTPLRPLMPIVLDTNLRIPLDCQLVKNSNKNPLLIFCGQSAFDANIDKVQGLCRAEASVEPLPIQPGTSRLPLDRVLTSPRIDFATHLLVEPGPTLAAAMLRESGLVDRLWVFASSKSVDDATAPAAAVAPPHFVECARTKCDDDVLIESFNVRSPTFAALMSSPELQQ